MTLSEKITTDLKEAMRAKDQARMRTIRAIKTSLQLAATDGSGQELNATREVKILQNLSKQRQDSLAVYEKSGRDDLATKEREELEIIQAYLPKMLSLDELKPIITDLIQTVGASSMKDMGKVMGMANKQLAGKANGKDIADVVKGLLS